MLLTQKGVTTLQNGFIRGMFHFSAASWRLVKSRKIHLPQQLSVGARSRTRKASLVSAMSISLFNREDTGNAKSRCQLASPGLYVNRSLPGVSQPHNPEIGDPNH